MTSENTGIDGLMKGWYSEVNSQWPGQAMSLEVEKVLLDEKSEYQHVIVFKSKTFGNVLVLDGVIQLTERDEMAYQEMIAHLPLFAHPDPKSVLIIGGGDGGVIREVVKHKGVKEIVICEIDQVVIDAGKKYFPTVAAAWDDKRVTLVRGDASKYVEKEENKDKFDVIICDSSDPVGPAQVLFETKFYQDMYNCLKAGGRACTQAESIWMHLELIGKLVKEAAGIYAAVEYATTQIPTYPCGQIGFLLCTKEGGKGRSRSTSNAPRTIPRGDEDLFRFYTHELHGASFVLPRFVQKVIDEKLEEARDEKASAKAEAKAEAKKRKSKGAETPKGKGKAEEDKPEENGKDKMETETTKTETETTQEEPAAKKSKTEQ